MPAYRVNDAGVRHARRLIDAGRYDDTTGWSEAAPSTEERNEEIEEEGREEWSRWYLAVDEDAGRTPRPATASPTGTSPPSTARRWSTPSSGPPRTTTRRSSRPPTSCCSGSMPGGPDRSRVVAEGPRVAHPVFARYYARLAASMEEHGAAGIRERLLAG